MFVIKNYVTTGGTVACALAIGYLMQSGTPAPGPMSDPSAQNAPVVESTALSGLKDIVLTSSSPDKEISAPHSSETPSLHSGRSTPSGRKDCTLNARAKAVPGAAAHLSVKAPCHGTTRIKVRHGGQTVTQMTDASGTLEMTVPALSEYAIFLISVDGGAETVATTHIPDMAR